MSADPLQNVSSGDPLILRADSINAWNEAARRTRLDKYSGGAATDLDDVFPAVTVVVRNDTGADLPVRSVVYLSDWIVSPVAYPIDAQSRPVFKAITPAATTNAVGILRDAIPDGEMGRAIVAGIAVADVLVNSSSHAYAQPIASDNTRLGSVASGPIRIIKWETSGATRRAYVLMGESATGGGVTVEDEDGSPSVIASTIKFPNTSLTNNGDGTVSVGLADGDSAAKAGLVSASQQYLAGTKYIVGNVYSANNSSASKTAEIALKSISGNPRVEAASDPITDGPISLYFLNTPAQPEIVLDCPSVILVPPRITIRQAGIDYAGVTGTGGGGDHYTGGICDTLGSGPSGIDGGTWT